MKKTFAIVLMLTAAILQTSCTKWQKNLWDGTEDLQIISNTVIYDGNGNDSGSAPEDRNTYIEGQSVAVLGNSGGLVKALHSFVGWCVNADGIGTSYVPGNTFRMGTSHVILYAKWTVNPTYTVTYDGNGNTGGNQPTDTAHYEQSSPVTVCGNPGSLVKPGHSFVGWCVNADGTGTSYVPGNTFRMGTSHVTLYAKWTVNPTYTVTYDGNGNMGGNPPTDTAHYEQSSPVTVCGNPGNLVKPGHSFVGWCVNADGTGTSYAPRNTFVIGTLNITLYAKWTMNPTYTVTYDGNGNTGGNPPSDITRYEAGSTILIQGNTGNLVMTGKSFVGWNDQADGSGTHYVNGDTLLMYSANIVLYAEWTINMSYPIYYNGNGNTGGNPPNDSSNYVTGETAIVFGNTGSLVKTGNSFAGWNTQANGTGTPYNQADLLTMGTSDVTLYAQWTTHPAYTVIYNGNTNTGGSTPVSYTSYRTGSSVTVLDNFGDLTKTGGYNFVGWNTLSDGSGTTYEPGSSFIMGSSDVTLYAKWLLYVWTKNVSSADSLWTGITSSSDGTKLAAVERSSAGRDKGEIWTSINGGSVWSKRTTLAKKWAGITSSSDGTKLAAVVDDGNIYTSTDGGVTWIERATRLHWESITSSSDGTKLAAVVDDGNIYTSTDSGVTWIERATRLHWKSIASSSDGTKLAAVVDDGKIFISTDSGITWIERAIKLHWKSITSSSDGIKLAAAASAGNIYISQDGGLTWNKVGKSSNWISIASSSDGTKLAAAVNGGSIFVSTNSGINWYQKNSSGNLKWVGVALSSDGSKIAAAEISSGGTVGNIWTSTQ